MVGPSDPSTMDAIRKKMASKNRSNITNKRARVVEDSSPNSGGAPRVGESGSSQVSQGRGKGKGFMRGPRNETVNVDLSGIGDDTIQGVPSHSSGFAIWGEPHQLEDYPRFWEGALVEQDQVATSSFDPTYVANSICKLSAELGVLSLQGSRQARRAAYYEEKVGEAGQRISALESEVREGRAEILSLRENRAISDARISELEGSVAALEQERNNLLVDRDNSAALIQQWEDKAGAYMDEGWRTCMRQLEILHPHVDRRGFHMGADIVDGRLVYPRDDNPFDDEIFIDVGDDNEEDGGGAAGGN